MIAVQNRAENRHFPTHRAPTAKEQVVTGALQSSGRAQSCLLLVSAFGVPRWMAHRSRFRSAGRASLCRSDNPSGLTLAVLFYTRVGTFLRSFLLTTRSLLWYITQVK